jgi:hypothetical protein
MVEATNHDPAVGSAHLADRLANAVIDVSTH